jgi:hypothetical protein
VKWWKPVKWEFQDGQLSVLGKNLWLYQARRGGGKHGGGKRRNSLKAVGHGVSRVSGSSLT